MRAQRSVLYVLGYAIGAVVIADIWLNRWLSLGSQASKIAVTVATAAIAAIIAIVQFLATTEGTRARAAEEAAATERARLAADIHATIGEHIHAIVVEIVAAHQAVVRGAYGDDVLARLTAADDNAHAAMETLNLLTATAPANPAKAPLPVA